LLFRAVAKSEILILVDCQSCLTEIVVRKYIWFCK
jgi:hypothetical protein